MRSLKTPYPTGPNPPVTSIAAHIILGLAMLGAVVLGAKDFSVQTLAYDIGETMELPGVRPLQRPASY
ncbi:MAG: hypothetical protein QNI90_14865 [Dinoroseobacter sp.]|nr:hypothetical protein [Dinoroseobacter sp.]